MESGRVLFALAATAGVAGGSFLVIKWMIGVFG